MLWIVVALLLLVAAFAWFRMALQAWLGAAAAVFALGLLVGGGGAWLSLFLLVVMAGGWFVLFGPGARGMRRRYLSAPLLAQLKQTLPPISQTERAAIDAGSVWWDAELFSGRPDWSKLFDAPAAVLSERERAFLDGPVEELCAMVNDWEVTARLGDLPAPVWDFIKRSRMFGLNIPAEYGGLGFSAHAQSCIVQKISTRSATAAVTVMVPNSLGPAELILHYGSDAQKQYYLPRLAAGEETPCFSLTNPWAGSDAAGMPDAGVVCRAEHDGESTLGFRLNWEKRYITLGPVATLIGLAFKAYDPDGLLGDGDGDSNSDGNAGRRDGENPGAGDGNGDGDGDDSDPAALGITCALIPADTPGITIGNRHLPCGAAFQNGPNRGEQVFIPLHWVIGGRAGVGRGWRMLMESLAAGRGVSLPAAAAGAAKVAARSGGAYARVREQFGVDIGRFEGVQEALARIGGLTYLLDAGRELMSVALGLGERPAVLSAIVKQQCTDLSRRVVNDALDIHGGKGICLGPRNYLARLYQQIPIGITVEGANILTRSLIIFGQGALRCHPHLLDEIAAVELHARDPDAALDAFDRALSQHLAHIAANKLRAFGYGISRGWLARGVVAGDAGAQVAGKGASKVAGRSASLIRRHSRAVEHLSAAFAFIADVTLLLLGGDLKRREMLSGRFADALGNLYLATAALKRFYDAAAAGGAGARVATVATEEALADEAALADWACAHALFEAQEALDGILRNYPKRYLGKLLRATVFAGGRYLRRPSDALARRAAAAVQTAGAARDRLTSDMYLPRDETEPLAQLEAALALMDESRVLRRRLKREGRALPPGREFGAWLDELRIGGAVNDGEAALLARARAAAAAAIAVDDFPPKSARAAAQA